MFTHRPTAAGLAVALVASQPIVAAAFPQEADQGALVASIRQRIAAAGLTRLVVPVPGSRSLMVAVDASTPLYLFLERGSIRGSAIDDFYAAYDAGDMHAAYEAFRSGAVPTVRMTDYGWNGLGVPYTTSSGTEIKDILYRTAGGTFGRAPEITDQDVDNYVSYLQLVLAALTGS